MTAIQELAEMTERVFGVTCVVEFDERLIVERPVAATNLYRIAQEAISNAVRHGGAHHLKITATPHSGGAILSIEDNGVGFGDRNAERAGLGLSIMKYRAEMIGGSLRVESTGQGTIVTCVLPGLARLRARRDGADG
jgi:signal transduction histidine kinase